jgi:hypothetical protein
MWYGPSLVEVGGVMEKMNQASAVQYWILCILSMCGFFQLHSRWNYRYWGSTYCNLLLTHLCKSIWSLEIAFMDRAAMNILVYFFLWAYTIISVGYIVRSKISNNRVNIYSVFKIVVIIKATCIQGFIK